MSLSRCLTNTATSELVDKIRYCNHMPEVSVPDLRSFTFLHTACAILRKKDQANMDFATGSFHSLRTFHVLRAHKKSQIEGHLSW